MLSRNSILAGLATVALAATPALAGSFDSASVAGGRALSTFDEVYVAPVDVALDLNVKRFDRSGSGDRPVSESDAQQKAVDFYYDLMREFSATHAIVDAPGPGVLTVEATLTKLESSRPTLADYGTRGGHLSASSTYAGGAEMVAVFKEGDAVLAEVADAFDSHLRDGRARAGIWSDADRAFRSWAARLAAFTRDN